MKKELFSPMEIDAIGEMMNISLGSSATAVSNLLDQRVDITTPEVTVVEVEDFSIGNLEPAMGVEIKYVEGLEGSNIMLLRRSDIKVIVDILMGGETPEEEFELNDLTISAVCEVMNQMMGAASTAMSDFLGFPVNISTPLPFELKSLQEFKENHLPQGAKTIVVVRFSLKIEKALESEFMNVMSVSLAKELLAGLGLEEEDDCPAPAEPSMASGGGKQLSQEEIEKLLAAERSGKEAPSAQEMPSGSSGGKQLSQEEIEKMMAGSWGEAPAEPLQQPPSASSEPADQLTQTKPGGFRAGDADTGLCTKREPVRRDHGRLSPILPVSTLPVSSPGSSGGHASRTEGDQHNACRYAGNGCTGGAWEGAGGKPGPDHGGPAADYRGNRADSEKGAGNPGLFQGVSCCAG